MSFRSPGFLFAFLPIFCLIYFAAPTRVRNFALLIGSLTFYSIDGGYITGVLIASIFVNQLLGAAIHRTKGHVPRLAFLWCGIVLNLAPLIYYKYWTFLLTVGHDSLRSFGVEFTPTVSNVILPAGISFFTFQGLSYLVDIYRSEIVPAKNIIDFGMYHTLFPQLIAGPIVRYREVVDRIYWRPITLENVEAGILRFCWGLGKKIVIGDNMGAVADHMFALPHAQLTTAAAWIAALSYTLQIYFDFSGYSDMAIGLGRMLGFKFPENFNVPYRSCSITEFWRRWHMTLSRWFRDYVYIPLGGNRRGPVRTYLNLLTVFVLCGLWHGAAYTFLVWGCYHGALLIIERVTERAHPNRVPPDAIRWPITLLLIVIGWVFFRASNLDDAIVILEAMAGFGSSESTTNAVLFVTSDKLTFFVIGSIITLSPANWGNATFGRFLGSALLSVQRSCALLLFIYSAALIAAKGFNPFIYFRF